MQKINYHLFLQGQISHQSKCKRIFKLRNALRILANVPSVFITKQGKQALASFCVTHKTREKTSIANACSVNVEVAGFEGCSQLCKFTEQIRATAFPRFFFCVTSEYTFQYKSETIDNLFSFLKKQNRVKGKKRKKSSRESESK